MENTGRRRGTVRHAAIYDSPIPSTNAPDREPVISATDPVHQGQRESARNVREPRAMGCPYYRSSDRQNAVRYTTVNLLSSTCAHAGSPQGVPASERLFRSRTNNIKFNRATNEISSLSLSLSLRGGPAASSNSRYPSCTILSNDIAIFIRRFSIPLNRDR